MDRGVKIAIFVASVVSLSLGLIWDQVLSKARVMVEKPVQGPMDAEIMNARVGSPDIERLEIVRAIDAAREAATSAQQVTPDSDAVAPRAPVNNEAQPDAGWTEHTLVKNDSWWSIAEKYWGKSRAHHWSQIEQANPGVRFQPGNKVKVPPHKPPETVSTGQ